RQEAKKHERPQVISQYKWKKWKAPSPVTPDDNSQKDTQASLRHETRISSRKTVRLTATSNKKNILTALEYEHPVTVLRLGLLETNAQKALPGQQEVSKEVVRCFRSAVFDAWSVKIRCQEIIGAYLITVFSGVVSDADRHILDKLCPRIEHNDIKEDGDGRTTSVTVENDVNDDSDDDNTTFIHSFMTALYSGNCPRSGDARLFVDRLQQQEFQGILRSREIGPPGTRNPPTDNKFPASCLTRSVSTQLYVELKNHFKRGTVSLYHKVKKTEKRPPTSPTIAGVDYNISTVENFWRLNKILNNPWILVPLSPVGVGFVTFTEYEFGAFFLNSRYPNLRAKMIADMKEAFPMTPEASLNQTTLVNEHIPTMPFGHLIKRLVCKIGTEGLTRRQKDVTRPAAAIDANLSLQDIRDHINRLRDKHFNPKSYTDRGYIMRGSIKTNGHELQLLVHKKKVLLGVRYRRFPDDRLPNCHLSTQGGTDHFLTEVRNVFRSAQDVQDLLGCSSDQVRQEVKVLGIDLGQAFVVGASAVRSSPPIQRCRKRGKDGKMERKRSRKSKRKKGRRGGKKRHKERHRRGKRRKNKNDKQVLGMEVDEIEDRKDSQHQKYYNMAVKQKAVYQPILKFRRWMEHEKRKLLPLPPQQQQQQQHQQQQQQQQTPGVIQPSTPRSISDIESSLPPLRGEGVDFNNYLDYRHNHEEQLHRFYNIHNDQTKFMDNRWYSKRAKEREYWLIADSLLEMVDGSMGAKRCENNKVIIGIGLGQFSGKNRLSHVPLATLWWG
ncbi:hypothetical protein FBU30_001909, partial [Linnemannia zychae]